MQDITVSKRDPRLDALKGLAILAVVAGHSIAVPQLTRLAGPGRLPFADGYMMVAAAFDPFYNVIQSFNMPLFAFVSGLLLSSTALASGGDLLKRRSLTLMLPYLSWTLLATAPSMVRDPAAAIASLGRALVNPEEGAAWFLYALFLCYALAVGVFLPTRSRWALALSAIAAGATVLLPLGNILGARNVALLYPFLVAGHLCRGVDWRRSGRAALLAAVAYPLTLLLTVPTTVGGDRFWFIVARQSMHSVDVAGKVTDVYLLSAAYHAARYACAGAGIVLLMWLYYRISDRLVAPQAWLGRRSLGVYLAHQQLLAIIVGLGLTAPLLLFIAVAAASTVVTLVLERIPVLRTILLGADAPRVLRTDPALSE